MTVSFSQAVEKLARSCNLAAPRDLWDAVRAAHATADRYYHDLDHVAELCQWFAQVAAGPGWQKPREVLLAIAFHDAVYVPGRSDNEDRSAALASEEIARWLPGTAVDALRVAGLIRLTARHGHDLGELDVDAAHFLDADMAILASSPERFAEYDEQIAREYATCVPLEIYRQGRAQFFRRLLASEHIYHSGFFRQQCEARARANLHAALGCGKP